MPLDPQALLRQIEEQRPALEAGFDQRHNNTGEALDAYRACESEALRQLVLDNPADRALAYPATTQTLLTDRHLVQKATTPYSVVATDSSPIPPDRHNGTALYHVINIGKVLLRYGPESDARLESETHFYAGEVAGEEGQEGATGLLMDVKSAVHELRSGLELARTHQADLVLRDGPLTLWNSATLRDKAGTELRNEYYHLLENFKTERLPLVGYISNTHSTSVINALRLYREYYQPRLFGDSEFAVSSANERKKPGRVKMRQLRGLEGVQDAMLFRQLLAESEHSPIFKTALGEPRELADYISSLCFVYLHTPLSNEIARLEFPDWMLEDPDLLDCTLSFVMSQYELGQGYPVAIMEAHEAAVLRGGDRELLHLLLEERGLLEPESEKGRSKRLRGI